MNCHKLKIISLPDTVAECSCGGWSMVQSTSYRDNEICIWQRINYAFKAHKLAVKTAGKEGV